MFTDDEVKEIHTKYPKYSWRIDLEFDPEQNPEMALEEHLFECSGRKIYVAKHPEPSFQYTFYKVDEA